MKSHCNWMQIIMTSLVRSESQAENLHDQNNLNLIQTVSGRETS